MTARLGLLALVVTAGCATVSGTLGVPGGQLLSAKLTTDDGAQVTLWRWTPKKLNAPRVLVLPEFAFDRRLVAPLCEQLRDAGYDVAALDNREVTGVGGTHAALDGWSIDVARAVAEHRPDFVIAIGIAGSAALPALHAVSLHGIVAINVPIVREVGNDATRRAFFADGYDPRLWTTRGWGALLLGRGRSTPSSTVLRLRQLINPVSPALGHGVEAFLSEDRRDAMPAVPMRALVSMKDNLIDSEDALPDGGREFQHTRRLALIEGFSADYGHLDWLVEPRAVDEVAAAVVEELEGFAR